MSVTLPRPPRMRSPLGFRPGRRARRDHARPHPRPCRRPQPARPRTPPPARRPTRPGGAARRRQPGLHRRRDHHPHQRPSTPALRYGLGQERRPLDDQRGWQARRADRPAPADPAHYPAARRLRRHLDRARLRHHHPRRPRRLRRHHARPAHRPGIPAAALHHAHPRPACEPSLPPGRRRRRPPQRDPPRRRRAPHSDRDLAADPGPRRLADLRHHDPA